MEAQPNVITPEVVAQSLSFAEYMNLVRQAVTQEQTTGLEQSAFLAQLTKNCLAIMERTYQTSLQPEIVEMVKNIPVPQLWLVLTEGWCGDAAIHVPVLAAIADQAPTITLKTILRTEQPEVMNAYLTNGGKSIPKLIVLHAETLQPLGTWGPRPQILQAYILELKQQELPLPEFIQKSLSYSEQDNGTALQAELLQLLPHWVKASLT